MPEAVPAPPAPQPQHNRLLLGVAAVVVVVILVGIAGLALHLHNQSTANSGYNNVTLLEASVTQQATAQLSNDNVQGSVSSVNCVPSGVAHHFNCLVTYSDNSTLMVDVTVSPDGQQWVQTNSNNG